MSPLSTEELLKYKDRLPGLIPIERIVAVDFPRPARQVVEGFKKLEEPTPTVSDILDSLGIEGTIPSSELKPIVSGKTIVGRATQAQTGTVSWTNPLGGSWTTAANWGTNAKLPI